MPDTQDRTLDDVDAVIKLAKLNSTDLLPVCQSLYFSGCDVYNNECKLIELDKQITQKLLEGQHVYISGEKDESSVLCMQNRTYDLSYRETSNSLLLTTPLKYPDDINLDQERSVERTEIRGIHYDYFDVSQRKPNFKKLYLLLEDSLYRGPEHEYEINTEKIYNFEELWSKIPSSKEELMTAIEKLQIITIDGKVRLLDFQYHSRVLSHMLKLIDSNSWNLDEIDYEETVNSLRDFVPSEIICSLFDMYTEESKMIDDYQLYKYDETKVCRFIAQVLLLSAHKFNLNDFLQAWQESVPDGMTTKEEMLYGMALVDRKSQPNVIRAFPEENLPDCIQQRFAVLFDAKEKWAVPEIAPYIERLTTDKLDTNALLAKYARASKINDIKHYSSKHSK